MGTVDTAGQSLKKFQGTLSISNGGDPLKVGKELSAVSGVANGSNLSGWPGDVINSALSTPYNLFGDNIFNNTGLTTSADTSSSGLDKTVQTLGLVTAGVEVAFAAIQFGALFKTNKSNKSSKSDNEISNVSKQQNAVENTEAESVSRDVSTAMNEAEAFLDQKKKSRDLDTGIRISKDLGSTASAARSKAQSMSRKATEKSTTKKHKENLRSQNLQKIKANEDKIATINKNMITPLNERIAGLEKEFAKLDPNSTDYEKKKLDIEKKIEDIKKQLTQIQERYIKPLEEENEQIRTENEALKTEIDDLETEIKKYNSDANILYDQAAKADKMKKKVDKKTEKS